VGDPQVEADAVTMDSKRHSSSVPLDAGVRARLQGVAVRLRRYVLIEGVAWVVGFLLCGAVVQYLLDYASRGMRWSMRAALLGVIVAYALWLLRKRIVLPLCRRIGEADVANLVERRFPSLSSSLISAVRFCAGDVGRSDTNSMALMDTVVREAGRRTAGLDFRAVLDAKRAKRALIVIAAVLVASAAATYAMPDQTGLWFARNVLLKDVAWPRQTHLVVDMEKSGLIGAIGDDILIEATAQGVQPREVEFYYVTAQGKRGRETMATVGSVGAYRYRFTFKNAQEDFTFHLVGGDDRTDDYPVRLLERPRIETTGMRIVPPAYTRLDPVELGDGQRAAQLLPGSGVTISATTNKPVARATLMAGGDPVAAVFGEAAESAAGERDSREAESPERVQPTTQSFEVTVAPRETATYEFALVDAFGLSNKKPVRFSLRVIKDDPPRVRLKLEGVGEMVTADAVLPMSVEASDTYGLATLELAYRVSGRDESDGVIALPSFTPRMTTFAEAIRWAVSTAAVAPGDQISFSVRASDFDDVSGPNVGETPETSLRVVTRDELLAELARREQEHRLDFERLVEAQEKLRGELLTALSRSGELDAGALAALLAPLERRQRSIAGSVNVIRQQFEQILVELRINQLVTNAAEQRLGGGIVEPLTKLARRDLVIAADTIRRWARDASPETASTVDPQQVAILQQMREALANMIQWEGYQEAVNMLRDILRMQAELEAETERAIEDQAGDIFDDKRP